MFPKMGGGGERFPGTDTLDVLRYDDAHAYVAVHLDFFNGHSCDIEGMAAFAGGALTLEPPELTPGEGRCRVTITPDARAFTLAAPATACLNYCGARGRLDGAQLPRASRRPIPHRAALMRSQDFEDAVAGLGPPR
jgi:hypothetical protein